MMTESEIKNLITKLKQHGLKDGAVYKNPTVRHYLTGAIEALEMVIGKNRPLNVVGKIWKGEFDTDRN